MGLVASRRRFCAWCLKMRQYRRNANDVIVIPGVCIVGVSIMAMANSDDRLDNPLDQTSKKLSVTLRKEQCHAVQSITAGNDTFVSLPTGGRKSTCFFVLPCLFDSLRNVRGSIVIVISPLLA